MATSSKPTAKTTSKTPATKPVSDQDDTGSSERSRAAGKAKADDRPYRDRAAALADEVRDAAADLRRQVDDLNTRVDDLQQTAAPTPADAPVAGGVRRVPMAVGDVHRALEGLTAAAVELQRRATA